MFQSWSMSRTPAAQTLPAVPATTSGTAPTAVTTTVPAASTAPVVVPAAPSAAYQAASSVFKKTLHVPWKVLVNAFWNRVCCFVYIELQEYQKLLCQLMKSSLRPWRFGKACKARGHDGKRISEQNLWGLCCSTQAWWSHKNMSHLLFMNPAGAVLCDADRLFGT